MPNARGISIPDPRKGHRGHFIPNPLPGQSDPEAREARKQAEKEASFNWKPVVLVGLIGTVLYGSFNRSLSKCERRYEEEDRQEEERRRRLEEREERGGSRSRDRGRGRERYDDYRQGRDTHDHDYGYGGGGGGRELERRMRSEGPGYNDREWEGRSRRRQRESSRPVSQVEGSRAAARGSDYREYVQYYYDPRHDREYEYEQYEKPRGRVYRERMRRRDSSW